MRQELTSEIPATAVIIDSFTKNTIDKESLIQLLKCHKVRTSGIEKKRDKNGRHNLFVKKSKNKLASNFL